MNPPIVEVRGLRVEHIVKGKGWRRERGRVQALGGVDLTLRQGEALGIAGESGSGKTTLARVLIGLQKATAGEVKLFGQPIPEGKWPKELRKRVQMVFQDASGFLDPRQSIVRAVYEPLEELAGLSGDKLRTEAIALLERVGLSARHANRLPHELSGGQRQRVAIAKALASSPDLVILDEPTSALDVSVQAQILNLLEELRKEKGMSYILISHDLNVIAHLCDRVSIMYLGRIAESGPIERVFPQPAHPYTKALLAAAPSADPNVPWAPMMLSGELPSAMNPPSGCAFHPRCPIAADVCRNARPEARLKDGVETACHLAGNG
ncbi:ABC transporter ATP-binding protein [Cohnella thermotolerans]|uniref:ABC transporter ATP-binding protein n=1 Tax=Cohnella thermotolerans TaxID=329858 RepID=UPI00042A79CF|nr:ABC transporter ATP-binding protein [Cohnella thermotolerans]